MIINIDGVDLLILDIINDKPFVLAFNERIKTKFDDCSNDYTKSILCEKCNIWLKEHNFKSVPRNIELDYRNSYETKVKIAPLSFKECRKYKLIIQKNIDLWFWTSSIYSSTDTFVIVSNGHFFDYVYCQYPNCYLVPAFILDSPIIKSFDNF